MLAEFGYGVLVVTFVVALYSVGAAISGYFKKSAALVESARRSKHEEPVVQRVVRKKRGHDEAHGSAWKVAFADFCLALAASFCARRSAFSRCASWLAT